MRHKYTKDMLEPIVRSSVSVYEVLRRLGINYAGGNHANIKKRIKEFELDTSHFLGQGWNKGANHIGGHKKKSWQERLVLRKYGKEKVHVLRRAMIESGIEYRCAHCGLTGIWNARDLTLEIHHKDGNPLDNRRDNLIFLCPNCHSQE